MITSTDSLTRAPRQRRRGARGGRSGRPWAERCVVLPMVAGLGAVLLLTAMALLTGEDTTATVAITAVGAIVSAALSHLRGGR
jgi:hypothetical protein